MQFWFELISADMTKVLVLTTNTHGYQRSYFFKLYGDPEQYAYKLANETFADKIPIHMNWIWFTGYGKHTFISLDQKNQAIIYGCDVRRRLEYAYRIYNNATFDDQYYYFPYVPETDQVLHY